MPPTVAGWRPHSNALAPTLTFSTTRGRGISLEAHSIVVLSSRTDEQGIVKALESGADDYVTKPFGMKELAARIRVALRHRLQQQGERIVGRSRDFRRSLKMSKAFFHRHGGKSVFLARFIPGVRAFVPLVAGITQISIGRFYAVNVLSALVGHLHISCLVCSQGLSRPPRSRLERA